MGKVLVVEDGWVCGASPASRVDFMFWLLEKQLRGKKTTYSNMTRVEPQDFIQQYAKENGLVAVI